MGKFWLDIDIVFIFGRFSLFLVRVVIFLVIFIILRVLVWLVVGLIFRMILFKLSRGFIGLFEGKFKFGKI